MMQTVGRQGQEGSVVPGPNYTETVSLDRDRVSTTTKKTTTTTTKCTQEESIYIAIIIGTLPCPANSLRLFFPDRKMDVQFKELAWPSQQGWVQSPSVHCNAAMDCHALSSHAPQALVFLLTCFGTTSQQQRADSRHLVTTSVPHIVPLLTHHHPDMGGDHPSSTAGSASDGLSVAVLK